MKRGLPLLLALAAGSLLPAATCFPKSAFGSTDTSDPIARLASKVSQLPIDEPALVVLGNLEDGGNPSFTAELSKTLHEGIASAVPLYRERSDTPLSFPEARTLARRKNLPLVFIAPTLRSTQLSLDIRFVRWPRAFWQRTLVPEGHTGHRSVLRGDVGELMRPHLAPSKRLFESVTKVQSPVSAPMALACRGNGSAAQVAVVGRREIHLGRFGEKSFLTETKAPWDKLSEVHPSPLRAPLGNAVFQGDQLRVGLSDRKLLVTLNSKLQLATSSQRAYPITGGQCLAFTDSGLAGTPISCASAPQVAKAERSLDAWASVSSRPSRNAQWLHATFLLETQRGGILRVTKPGSARASERKVLNAGDQAIWADLDGDGAPELVHSSEGNASDEIRVDSLSGVGFRRRASLDAPQVHALTVCPFDGKNPRAVVAAVGKELWWIR